MTISRRKLYAIGEPLGECVTRKEAGRMVCGGGGGGGGESTTVQNIPEELKPLAARYTQDAIALSDTPWQAYGGHRFADMNQTQGLGIGQIQNRALNGDPTVNAGAGFLQGQLASGPQSATRNPYGDVSAGQNAYAGSNAYLNPMIDAAMGDVTRNYEKAVMPGITGAKVSSGSFGNSGVAEMEAESQRQLASELGRVSSGMRFNDYTAQQGLAENAINRDMQAQQFNSQMGNDFAGRNDAARQAGIGNQFNAAQMGLQYGNQAYTDAGQLMNAGNFLQDQQQQKADFGFQQFQDWQNDPYKKLAAMSGVFGSFPGQSSTTTSSGGGK